VASAVDLMEVVGIMIETSKPFLTMWVTVKAMMTTPAFDEKGNALNYRIISMRVGTDVTRDIVVTVQMSEHFCEHCAKDPIAMDNAKKLYANEFYKAFKNFKGLGLDFANVENDDEVKETIVKHFPEVLEHAVAGDHYVWGLTSSHYA